MLTWIGVPSTTSAAARLPLPVARNIFPAPTVGCSCQLMSFTESIYNLTGF